MKENEKIWKEKNGAIPVQSMSTNHIKKAFLSLSEREYRTFLEINLLYTKIDTYQGLKNMLKSELESRGEEPIYPDQQSNPFTNYGKYFEAERDLKKVEPVKAVISAEKE